MIDYSEQALLSVLIADNNLIDSVSYLKRDDFEEPFYGAMFDAIDSLHQSDKKADIITLADKLRDLAKGDVYSRLYAVINTPKTAENLSHYANNIVEASKRRKLGLVIRNLIHRYDKQTESTDMIIQNLMAEVSTLETVADVELKPFGHLAERFFDLLDKRMSAKDGLAGISTGFSNLDALTSGFLGGQLIVLGARPGNGKTTLASNIALSHVKNGGQVAFFSLEMPDISIYERLISSDSGVNASKIKRGDVDPESLNQLLKSAHDFKSQKMFLLDAQSAQDISRLARQIKKKHGLSMIVVDYLGLLLGGKHEHAHLVLGEITRTLKKLAIQLDVPILLLSQLNRESEKRPDSTPKLSDLRQSGSIEQDADIVMFLSQYDKDKPSSPLHGYGILDIAKHRDGSLETLILGFEGHRNRFVETTMTYARFEELKGRQKKSEPEYKDKYSSVKAIDFTY
jgi:replicative DNA helicase